MARRMVALLVFLLAPLGMAASRRSGGRAGGRGFRSSRSMSRRTQTRRNAAATDTTPAPQQAVAVPVMSPFGFGGFGLSPGMWFGMSLVDSIMHEQRRAEMMRQQLETQKQLGKDAAEIEALKTQLANQEKRIADLQAKKDAKEE